MSATLLLAVALNMECVENQLKNGDQSQTLDQVKAFCSVERETTNLTNVQPESGSKTEQVDRRVAEERGYEYSRFGLSSHRNNYVLLGSYNNRPNEDSWEYEDEGVDPWEIKFQFSVKVPITPDWFGNNSGLYMAYTNQSWWQAYNKDASAPFRDTNHMPEMFWLQFFDDVAVGDFKLRGTSLSLNHQSNGRSGEESRSWNRIIGTVLFENGPWVFGARAWHRLHEDNKESIDDVRGDDNPDITDYMGHGEVFTVYSYQDNIFSLRVRGNIGEHKGGAEAGWSFPLTGKIRGYIQGYYGYGESLIDYNHKSERISIGVEVTPII
ncbi:phospholipase A [Ferrimonas lipolytica]|uniref:Phospholipase A1 n=1 Tax=Ferrimonas lipolytica TaxID=2724191 RepID=A0A6H1UGU6_9GAMM|nr:phospholipase A [Ferrimonas lipolytica]QIZ77436.1 phospholipase A [Ferrimonas lipolytica]